MSKLPNQSPIPANDQEQLVAYLDGELDPSAVEHVERRLSGDPHYRDLLNSLDRSWEMLDELPRGNPSERFTQTTVEMVAVDVSERLEQENPLWARRQIILRAVNAGFIVAALCLGYLAIDYALDGPNRRLMRDLPVIQRVDIYQQIDDISYLEALANEGLFNQDDEMDEENAN